MRLAYLEPVFPSVPAPCDMEVEPFDRDEGTFTERQLTQVERRERLKDLRGLGTYEHHACLFSTHPNATREDAP